MTKDDKKLYEILSEIKDYIIRRILVSRKGDPDLKTKIILLLIIHDFDIRTKTQEIYNGKSIETALDNYVELLLKEYDKIDLQNPDDKIISELNYKKLVRSSIIQDLFKVASVEYSLEDYSDDYLSEDYPLMAEYQDKILENYRKLAEELDIKSGLDLSHYFTYLLWNGFFSPTKRHLYQLSDRIIYYPTLEVFLGKGVCRNYASLLEEFLIKCGNEARRTDCFVSMKTLRQMRKMEKHPETPIDEKAQVLRASVKRSKDTSNKEIILWTIMMPVEFSVGKLCGNHSITFVRDKNKEFYYDPTMIYVLQPQNNNSATIINGFGEYLIKSHQSIHSGYSGSIGDIELLKKYIQGILTEEYEVESYTSRDVIETMDRVFNSMERNKSLLDDAYEEIKPTILKQEEEIKRNKKDLQVFIKKRVK